MFQVQLIFKHHVISVRFFSTYEECIDYAKYAGPVYQNCCICISRA